MNKEHDQPYGNDKQKDQNDDYKTKSEINNSGNSEVDVHITIDIDVKPVAFAMLYSLLASKQLTEHQFEDALKRLQEL